MDEKKIVTWEMFKKYHEQLMGHIEDEDGIDLEEELYSEDGECEKETDT